MKSYDRIPGDTVRANFRIAELMWDDGEWFYIVPREKESMRSAELCAWSEDTGSELQLHMDRSSLLLLRDELDALLEWIEETHDEPEDDEP